MSDEALAKLYDRLNEAWWTGNLPKIPVRWSGRMHAIAGKYWRSRRRGWEIVLSASYHAHFPDEIEETLKHEMVHVWQQVNGRLKRGRIHGADFRREASRVGAPLHCRSYQGMRRPYRYEWICPSCGRRSRSRIRRAWACKPCCQRHNGGRYSVRFKLQLAGRGDGNVDRASTRKP